MMWLFDSPWPILVMGGLTLAIIAGGWFQTQRKELLGIFVAALVLVGGLLILERSIVTDREQLASTIEQMARAAEQNDIAALARHIHSQASEMRGLLESRMALVQIEKVSVKNNLRVTVDPLRKPRTAVVTFNVVVTGSDRAGVMKSVPYPRFITATFELEDGQWRVTKFKDDDVQVGSQIRQE
ncbi:MAG TPA: hypothetical protein VL096_07780 [Pirellulaceae bacterium]|nr:hypothetical protein [Pirellulaceae bacterium]